MLPQTTSWKATLIRSVKRQGITDKQGANARLIWGPCRVAVKTGKRCAIKTGMGLEDGNMQQDEGFGIFVWGMAEVVGVAIGLSAADDFGAGWGVNGMAL
jgi:hypothetical protein